MKPTKFEAGQVHTTTYASGQIPVTVKILKRTPKSARIHVTAVPLTAPEGEEFTRKLIVADGYEVLYPLGSYICGAPTITLINQ